MLAGRWKFWKRSAWHEWSAERRAWLSYRASHNDLTRRATGASTRLAYTHQTLKETRQAISWVEPLGTSPVPIDLKRQELGLMVIPDVTLLEQRKREGQGVWVPISVGSVSFTDRRAVFQGGKEVTFEYKDLSDATLIATGLHLSVHRRKTSHVLAGPAQRLQITLEACRSVGADVDPLIPLKDGEREAVAAVADLQGELARLNQVRQSLARPKRPFSPAWATAPVFLVVLFGVAGGGLAGQQPEISPTTTTSTTVERETSSPLTLPSTTTTVATDDGTVTVASITDGDTFRVILADGTNEPVRLIGIDSPESGEHLYSEAKEFLASLLDGNEVILVADVSDTDTFGRLLRYVYVGDLFVNLEMVKSGYAIAVEYPPDTAESGALGAAAQVAEGEALGLWAATTTTTTSTTTTTTAPTTTTTAPPATTQPPASNCHPSYEGDCLQMGIGDYDCEGGSGNGPNYVRGPVRVVGYDEFGLDGNDNDGWGCES
jgi:endonuclease YncB( thermonuclease family)